MPIIVVGAEKNFAALRPRLLAAGTSARIAGEVADDVRKANPGVNLDRLTPGTVLTIPDSPHVSVRGELSLDETTRKWVAAAAEQGKAALGGIAEAATKRQAETKTQRAKALAALDAVGSATRPRERGLAKDLENARKGVVAEEERATERAAALARAQADWTAGLDTLAKLLG